MEVCLATNRSHKRVRKILNRDESICIIKTPAGLYHVSREDFASLLVFHSDWLVQTAPRVATVAGGYAVTICNGRYTFYNVYADGGQNLLLTGNLSTSASRFNQSAPLGIFRPNSKVYLIGHPLLAHVKVGFANDPDQRLKDLQTGSSVKLDLLGYIDGDVELERDIHKKLEPWRLMGEWFALSSENAGIIKEIFGIDVHGYLRASCRVEINGSPTVL